MKYAVDPNNWNGNNYHLFKDDGSGMIFNKSFEETKQEEPGLVLMDEEEFNNKYYHPHIESYRTDWKEVTKDEWWDLYECLPPYKAGNHKDTFFFCCPEATTGWMHTWGARRGDKYYMATRDKYSKPDELIKDLPCT